MTLTDVLLVTLAIYVTLRARAASRLAPAASLLRALALWALARALLAETSSPWLRRLDGALVAGAWPGAVAVLLIYIGRPELDPRQWSQRWLSEAWHKAQRRDALLVAGAFGLYGMAAVALGRIYPGAWLALLIAPRFAVGLVATWIVARTPHPIVGALAGGRSPSGPALTIGVIIAACQVAAAAFLWSDWGDVRVLSCGCWIACGAVIWRAR